MVCLVFECGVDDSYLFWYLGYRQRFCARPAKQRLQLRIDNTEYRL